ncbi:MAG: type I DNA topoisomerase [Acidobacteriota bacterium]
MAKSLVIVESPAKAKTINKFLGKNYVVKASMGHLRDLPKTKLGVDEEADFAPTYVVVPDKKKKAVVADLRKAAARADDIYLAPDMDREGEAISFHLKEILSEASEARFHRVLFNEITRKAILEAFKHPTEIDRDRVYAQQARRILDRLVGYKISPLLWDKVRRGLSAGRVQSVALRMITEREREIQAFEPVEYWSLTARLTGDEPPPFDARLHKIDGKKAELPDESTTTGIVERVRDGEWRIGSVTARAKKRNPPPPFITSQLQQTAAARFGFPVRRTMMLAQRLYEGIELGERGAVGLITYMRTDATRVSDEALTAVRDHIASRFGKDHLPASPRTFKARKGAQAAHEAIRPTSLDLPPAAVASSLGKEELKLYTLIWERFVASQMVPAVFDTTTADIAIGGCVFRATGSVLKFPGYLAAHGSGDGGSGQKDREEGLLPPLAKDQVVKLLELDPRQHFTQPPPRFTEATLVKALEENGIGRPSTYAAIIGTLYSREYVIREAKQKTFKPSELGVLVSDLLVESFGDLINVDYTARMEEELDEIEEGRKNWVTALAEFNEKFTSDLERARVEMTDVKRQEIPTDQTCSKCDKPMVIKWGRFGRFLACTGYPDCKNTQELAGENGAGGAEADLEATCEKCGAEMVVKRGRYGRFLACTGYPDCKNTRKILVADDGTVTSKPDQILSETCPKCAAPLALKQGRYGEYTSCSKYPECRYIKLQEVGVPCPEENCPGQIVVRRSKRGRVFYGCGEYPQCKFVTWSLPLARTCPDCGSPYLLEKTTKRAGTEIFCPDEACDYKESVAVPSAPGP